MGDQSDLQRLIPWACPLAPDNRGWILPEQTGLRCLHLSS